jgi:hypothetical protein
LVSSEASKRSDNQEGAEGTSAGYLIFLGGRNQGSYDGSDLQLTGVPKELLSADQNTKMFFEAWTRDLFSMN